MRSILLAIALAVGAVTATNIIAPQTAQASDYYNGYTYNGFTFNDGYWWKGDWAYNRVRQSYRYWDGCRYCNSYRWVFSKSHQRVQQKAAPAYEGWRQDLLKMAAAQHKWNFELKQSEQEQKEFLEALKALGLEAYYNVNTAYPSNLTGPAYAGLAQQGLGAYSLYGASSTYQAPLAAQGSTVYGYDSIASVYPDVDLKLLYNQANNLAMNAQQLAAQSTGDFAALVSQADNQRAEIARIIARGQAAAQVLEMLRDRPETKETHTEFMLRQDRDGTWKVVPRQPGDPAGVDPGTIYPDPGSSTPEPGEGNPGPTDGAGVFSEEDKQALFASIQNRCVACHGPKEKKGGLDMTKFLSFDLERKAEIVQRLVTEDVDKRMPRKVGGGPTEALPFAEVALYIRAAGLQPGE